MPYKTILVHVDESRHINARIELAARIAQAENAHLIGVAVTGVPTSGCNTALSNRNDPDIARQLAVLRQMPIDALELFETIARQIGVASFEKRLIDEDAAGGISLQTRYCDLAVLSQYDPNEQPSAALSDFPECVVKNSACPALIVPYRGQPKTIGNRLLIAWNGSMEATRAVHNAIPLLQRAKTVEVAIFNPGMQAKIHGENPGADIALYLARHDITVDIIKQTVHGDVGDALLSLAADLGSDMLVMGFFGRARFGEIVLAGATRTVLISATIPVLISH